MQRAQDPASDRARSRQCEAPLTQIMRTPKRARERPLCSAYRENRGRGGSARARFAAATPDAERDGPATNAGAIIAQA